jgi:hypothetical protein
VDAIAGWMWLEGIEGRDKIFYTTGRLTSEMVIKAAQMQVPVLVSRSGLTKMGHEVAQRVGITMIGRAVNRRYLLFTGAHRLVRLQPSSRPSPKEEGDMAPSSRPSPKGEGDVAPSPLGEGRGEGRA